MPLNLRLLFKINALVGRYRWLDAFGWLGARVAIVLAGALYGGLTVYHYGFNGSWRAVVFILGLTAAVWLVGWMISLVLGAILRRPRPFITYPQLKKLFEPFTRWKSFPSDHAIAAWLFAFLGIGLLPYGWVLTVLALWVSWGRIYTAMHYPGDVLGGFAIAGILAAGVWYWFNFFLL